RLGSYPCSLKKGSNAYKAYKKNRISERHRHRYEFNNKYKAILEKKGMLISGTSPNGSLVEIVEIPDHPWFVASQFHPEFQSKPDRPHPLFKDFIGAALKLHQRKIKDAGKGSVK
ncbi:MAG: CTP synthase, partial [Candidatus Omnitrophica bacterium]|nr:CTP synthase [Candidatus Omnitrophota bacterium]